MNEIATKTAIITGSTRGIGRAIAKSLSHAGIAVVINGTSEERVEAVAAEVRAKGGAVVGVVGRVEEMETGKKLTQAALESFGRVDYLVNNAGIVADRMSHKLSENEWDRVLAVHAKGTFSCTQPFLQAMKESGQGGVIINMTSLAGLQGVAGQLNYAASKGAILAMTYTLAQEWKKSGIRVHAVSPAALTDMTRPHVEKAVADAAARGEELPDYWRIGQPEDVAALVLWLIENPVKTGTVWGVNGKQISLWSKPVYQKIRL